MVVVLALHAQPAVGHGRRALPPDPADVGDGGVLQGGLEVGEVGQPGDLQTGLGGEFGGADRGRIEQDDVPGRRVLLGGQRPAHPVGAVQELAAATAALGPGHAHAEQLGDRVAVLQQQHVRQAPVLLAADPGEDAQVLAARFAEVPYGGDLARHEHRALGVEDDQGLHRGLQQFRRDVLDGGGVAAGQLAGDQAVAVPGGAQQQPHAGPCGRPTEARSV
ncbi:hypothetical protein O1M54_13135 [Streptomyces diastatochromogenes]|nr:hypothetical protein [Streptomyces diastatochromogenes]